MNGIKSASCWTRCDRRGYHTSTANNPAIIRNRQKRQLPILDPHTTYRQIPTGRILNLTISQIDAKTGYWGGSETAGIHLRICMGCRVFGHRVAGHLFPAFDKGGQRQVLSICLYDETQKISKRLKRKIVYILVCLRLTD